MRHHFGDFLDREGNYWTVIPNRERYAYRIGDVPAGSPEITIVTIGKADEKWSRVQTLPNLDELTLHEPTVEQLDGVSRLRNLKRLRITHARPKNLEFVCNLQNLEELVLEYVSGFDDISPVGSLTKLRALHIENLRRVNTFDGLRATKSLKYLAIHGTCDWHQPISDFDFLSGMPQLEVLKLWQVICRAPYPAALPMRHLCNLKKLNLHGSYLAAEEYALIEECLPRTAGARWGAYRTVATDWIAVPANDIRSRLPPETIRTHHPEVLIRHDGRREIENPDSLWHEFTGRAAGRVKCSSKAAEAKCNDLVADYEEMRRKARSILNEPLAT
ncbi:conserved hypothetical protein [Luteimonas sp. 9C]|uniref:hypothetical protein n=1 Tax=Luteimonas sp. 9C TaxID=2653148 RepID=UPI0012F15182|nr:hypothetical protein [Luteimonas sp. 9C]VXB72027.1 conserved hypothetical protein [Luteimonas sp. 9C]